jgi:ABC-type glycerol-3-phosphate transport system substrate-binding protein
VCIPPALVDFFTNQDGVIGCMPKGMDSIAVACSKVMFEKYGVELPNGDWTWDDMLSVCASLKDKMDGAGDDACPMALELNSIKCSWGHIMFQFGGSLFEDGKCTFNTPENVNAFKGITDMIDKGYIPDYTVVSDTSAEDLYISEKAAMIYLPTFSSQKIEQSDMKDTILVTLPKAESKDAMLIGMGYGMNVNGEHKEQAWRFLKYLGSEEANEIIGKSGIDMPAMTSMQKYYPESFKNFDGNPFVDQIQYTKTLVSAVEHSVGSKEAPEAARIELMNLLNDVDVYASRLEELLRNIEDKLMTIPYVDKLMEIKGIGLVTVSGFIAEVGDIGRFDNPKQLQKLAGYAIVANDSGKHNGESRISYRGRKRLRYEDTVVCVLGEHESQSGEAASRAFLTLPEE